jgi:uncharacterized protein YhfF
MDDINSGADAPMCVVKVVDVRFVPFNEISPEYAQIEGEGDLSLNYWKTAHRQFFEPYFLNCGMQFTEETVMVCIYFEVCNNE